MAATGRGMRVPARPWSWTAVATLVVLATGDAVASAITSPPAPSAAKVTFPTSIPPVPSGAPSTPLTLPTTTLPAPVEGIDAVDFLNSSDGYGLFSENSGGVSCSLSVASTKDGGSTFSARVPLPSTAQCYRTPSISSDSLGDGFIFGPGLYVTHDAGATWADDSSSATGLDVVPLGRSVWMLQTPPSTHTGSWTPALSESSDGGRTWSPARALPPVTTVSGAPVPPPVDTASLLRTSLTTAYVVVSTNSTAATVFVTTDGAQTWHQVLAPCLGGWVESLSQGFDGSLWLACAGQPSAGSQLKSVARSFDGGKTWVEGSTCPPLVTSTTYPPCAESNGLGFGYLSDISALSGTTALIDGGRSPVEITQDGGTTWKLTNPPIGGDANGSAGLFFANERDGWVISQTYGAGGPLWRTTDGGEQWSQVWPPSHPSSGLVPALQTHNPMVIVTPSSGLTNGQQVDVHVTGFGIGGKVWLSECASATEANDQGCGHGLPAQTLLVTDNNGSGSMTFQVQSSAPPEANDDAMTDLQPCTSDCVLVATLGGGFGFAYSTLSFRANE